MCYDSYSVHREFWTLHISNKVIFVIPLTVTWYLYTQNCLSYSDTYNYLVSVFSAVRLWDTATLIYGSSWKCFQPVIFQIDTSACVTTYVSAPDPATGRKCPHFRFTQFRNTLTPCHSSLDYTPGSLTPACSLLPVLTTRLSYTGVCNSQVWNNLTIQTLHQPAHLHRSDTYLPLSLVPAQLTDTGVSIQFSPSNRYK